MAKDFPESETAHISPFEAIRRTNEESDKLIANLFRASQTRQKLEREHIQGKEQANRTHHEMGRKVREFIQEVGGTLPEDLPTPEESIQELQARERRQLLAGQQPSLFEQEKSENNP